MKTIINKILNIYNIVLLTALMITGFRSVNTPIDLIFPFLLLPVFFYFTGGLLRQFKKTNWIFFIYSFIFSIIILVADLVNVKKISDLILVGIVMPLPIYLILNFIKEIKLVFRKVTKKEEKSAVAKVMADNEEKTNLDESKRKFLKLLAGTGLTTVILYLFNPKKAGAAFFGSGGGSGVITLKDTDGNKISPAVNSPTDGFGICDIATVETNNYYGYTDKNGRWYILKENATGNSFQYASRLNNQEVVVYSTAWTGKTGLIYGNFKDAF